MAEITLPTLHARSYEMTLLGGDSALEMMNSAKVTVTGPNALWRVSIPLSLEAATEAIKRSWRSALVQLVNLENSFKVTPPDWPGNGASYTGSNPLVNGAGQLGLTLSCSSASISTAVALDGDFLEVNGELKILTADATSDGSGFVTFAFEPALRQAPPDTDPVDVKTPKATFQLLVPNASWMVTKPTIYNITLEGLEKFDIS